MPTPQRLVPLVEQFDWGCQRLHDRMTGPAGDSGTGTPIEVVPITDDESLGAGAGLLVDPPPGGGPGAGRRLPGRRGGVGP